MVYSKRECVTVFERFERFQANSYRFEILGDQLAVLPRDDRILLGAVDAFEVIALVADVEVLPPEIAVQYERLIGEDALECGAQQTDAIEHQRRFDLLI